ncbi:subunit Srp68 of signal recognition particle [Chloropicon primus]|uniref:Signal recognition particle subunit SRP68 n=1 Tax=Chloropicon primus TaxID=1764295 RepID=A0A5B8MWS8_9CHLO|nr:subunit Srp68 of signal recognition particle [Chloropicon primus]UPR03244.1 subunit Srp68 of signal recognition particle [Chloropicon primus]|eukprot:QDZ24032.1 subunit Srp68 of signal recognition particle [Chloropicon primus]
MAEDGEAVRMEEAGEVERYDLSVFSSLRKTQTQQGMRHGDYLRYSKYCTRRLLRLYKSLKHTHGKGKYEKRELKACDVTEERYFLIPLMCAERVWAQAMEIKKEMENSKKWRGHRKQHMAKKLRKASKWADDFTKLCSARATSRTVLESEAYASFMKGTYLMEVEEKWQAALQQFLQTRALYEKLTRGGADGGADGGAGDSSVFIELQSEIEPVILFCKYQQQKEQGTSKLSDLQQLKDSTEGMSAHLKAQLDSLMSGAEGSAMVGEIAWRGKTVAIPGKRLVSPTSDVVAQIKKMEEDSSTSGKGAGLSEREVLEKRLGAYGSLFTMFDTVKQIIHSEKSEVAGGGASAMSAESKEQKKVLEQFERMVSGLMLESHVKRNVELIQSKYEAYIPSNKEGRRAINTTPEEMYRLYEHLKLDVFDLSELASRQGEEDEALYDECSVAMNAIKTILCFFLGEHYNTKKQDKEAFLLYNRAIEHSDRVEDSGAKVSNLFAPILAAAENISGLSRIGRCITHARACASNSVSRRESFSEQAAKEDDATETLLDNLSKPKSFVGNRKRQVCRLPPSLKSLPCQPFLLDTAIDHIKYPEVPVEKTLAEADQAGKAEEEATAASSLLGGVTSMFGWGSK